MSDDRDDGERPRLHVSLTGAGMMRVIRRGDAERAAMGAGRLIKRQSDNPWDDVFDDDQCSEALGAEAALTEARKRFCRNRTKPRADGW